MRRDQTMDLLARGLPKWPQMLTTGAPVTADQAREIIRRTDRFLVEGHGGNDVDWGRKMAKRLRVPYFHDWLNSKAVEDLHAYWAMADRWRVAWGAVRTQYVRNCWLSSSYIHGWCWPDGTIVFTGNVGKWPSVGDVLDDWRMLAEAFPFLTLAATLMGGEDCEDNRQPVVTILVEDGAASLAEGSLQHHERFPKAPPPEEDELPIEDFSLQNEHGPIPEEWYTAWEQYAASIQLTPP